MGYRSDVVLAVAVPNEFADTLLAAYMIQPGVAEHKCMQGWRKKVDGDVTIFWAQFNDVKWYEGYSDVQALERMLTIAAELCAAEGSTMHAATCKMRVGEGDSDIERDVLAHGDDPHWEFAYLREVLEERFFIRCEVIADCDGEYLEGGDDA